MFSASDDSTMLKQIVATHAPDGRDVDVSPILAIAEDVFRRAALRLDGMTEVYVFVLNSVSLVCFCCDCLIDHSYIMFFMKFGLFRAKICVVIDGHWDF